MIDEIFEMIMKEARERPGKDLVKQIATVQMDLHLRIGKAMEDIRDQERRQDNTEG